MEAAAVYLSHSSLLRRSYQGFRRGGRGWEEEKVAGHLDSPQITQFSRLKKEEIYYIEQRMVATACCAYSMCYYCIYYLFRLHFEQAMCYWHFKFHDGIFILVCFLSK